MVYMGNECGSQTIEVFIPFGQNEGGATFTSRLHDILADEPVARAIANQLVIEVMELDTDIRVWRRCRLKCRRAHEYLVFEGVLCRLLPGIDTIPHRPALHEDDRMVAVLSRHGGGQARDKLRLGLAGDLLETLRGQMVAFHPRQGGRTVRQCHSRCPYVPGSGMTGNVQQTCRLLSPATDPTYRFRRQAQERGQSLYPLVHQLPAMHEDESAYPEFGDQPRGNHSLTEGGGGRQYSGVMVGQSLCCKMLFRPQVAMEGNVSIAGPCTAHHV